MAVCAAFMLKYSWRLESPDTAVSAESVMSDTTLGNLRALPRVPPHASVRGQTHLEHEAYKVMAAIAHRQDGAIKDSLYYMLAETFYDLDRLHGDGDGEISIDEMERYPGISRLEAAQLFREMDLDGNGSISLEEFLRVLLPRMLTTTGAEPPDLDNLTIGTITKLQEASRLFCGAGSGEAPTVDSAIEMFRRLDRDGNMVLDSDELKAGLRAVGADGESFLRVVDRNQDGEVSFRSLLWTHCT